MPPMLMAHTENPADAIFKRVKGLLEEIELFGNQVLVGVYERPNITKSGIHLADVTVEEDRYQGKSALVLALGPTAFVSDAHYDFKGMRADKGDWVAIFVSDGRKIVLQDQKTGQKQLCRIVEDQHIRLKIPAPDAVF